MNELKVVKITHREADVTIREKFSLNTGERTQIYFQLRDYLGIKEALILSTCNRTEIYYVHKHDLKGQITGLLGSFKGINSKEVEALFTSIVNGAEALKHLYRVAIGLDSLVLGDIQIFGQVKETYQESADLGMSQALLHRALHCLFYTHKQVCQQTSFKDGAASTAYNTIKLLMDEKLLKQGSKIIVAGAGQMGTDVCRNLVKLGYHHVTVTNRSQEKAEDLGEELNINTLSFGHLSQSLDQYDILISTIGADEPVFHMQAFHNIKSKLVCVDLGTPRSFDETFVESYATHYFNIDQVGQITDTTFETRRAESPKVEALIDQSLSEFDQWVNEYTQTSELRKFKETLDELRKSTISAYLKKMDPVQAELIEEVSKSIVKKIIKLPALQLKQACERERAETLSQTLNELFNPEYQSNSKSKEKL